MKRSLLSALFLTAFLGFAGAFAQEQAKEKIIFDFEDAADLKAWANVLPDPKAKKKDPPAKIELVAENATSGKQCLKLTFAGGKCPAVATEQVAQDWLAYQTFQADVTVSRECKVGFAIMQDKGEGPPISRWTKTAFLQPGKNRVTASLPRPIENVEWGKIARFEIFMFAPRDGESIYVDNIRLSTEKPASR